MNPLDETRQPDPEGAERPAGDATEPAKTESLEELAARIVVHKKEPGTPESQPGEVLSLVGAIPSPPPPPPPQPNAFLPEDLRISWSWPHLLLFGVFAFGSLVFIQTVLAVYYQARYHLNLKQLEELFQNDPKLAVGSNVVWFFLIFVFLYVTLGVLRDRPFWPALGWKKLGAAASMPSNPWIYFAGGIGLALCVAIVSSQIKTPDHIPIQDLFKNRTGAILLMSMAVLVAPLVEETVFRGYLYPLLASTTARIFKGSGVDAASAVRAGTSVGVVVTGTLFGLLHGAQLGWTWALVGMLTTVGIIFTFARARAGTVLASFLLHLGYNSMIAVSAIVSTKGFTQMPPHP